MKNLILFLGIGVLFIICAFKFIPQDKDYNTCVKKYDSKWGEECKQCPAFNNSYKVFLRNTCDETIDVKCAVQEVDKRWRTFTHSTMAPNDTMIAYACNGSGKFRYWARKSGDKSVTFPTDNEINSGGK